MKTLATSVLILSLTAGLLIAQNVSIPDTAFLYALIDEGVDTNGNWTSISDGGIPADTSWIFTTILPTGETRQMSCLEDPALDSGA